MTMNNKKNTAMPEVLPLGGARGGLGGLHPIKNRQAFFSILEEALQDYFDRYDTYWGGILHLTVGVKTGQVGGIIKSENMLSYEGFTLERVRQILQYVLPQFLERPDVQTAIDYTLSQLRNGNDTPLERVFNKTPDELEVKEPKKRTLKKKAEEPAEEQPEPEEKPKRQRKTKKQNQDNE